MIGLFGLHRSQLEFMPQQSCRVTGSGMEARALEPPILKKLVARENESGIVVVSEIARQHAKHTLIGVLEVAQLFTDQGRGLWHTRERIEPETAYGSHGQRS
jgi:hypothetical protein